MMSDPTWNVSEDNGLKLAVLKNLSECKIEILNEQVEIAILKVCCDLKNKADNPNKLQCVMKKSQKFPDERVKKGFDSLKSEIQNANEEEKRVFEEQRDISEEQRSAFEAEKHVFRERAFKKRCESFDKFKKELNGFAVCKEKASYAEESEFLFVLAELKGKALLDYKGIITYVLADLLKEAERIDELSSSSFYRNYFKGIPNQRVLFGNYVDAYLRSEQLPTAEVLIELSAERYEGSESEARIYFDGQNITVLGTLSEEGEKYRIIKSENRRMIRKMMEIAKKGSVYLYADKGIEGCQITKLAKGEGENGSYIKFFGFMCWSIINEGKEEIIYRQGQYELNQSENDREYLVKIKNMRERISGSMPEKLRKWFADGWLEKLIEILRDQKHGTAVILTDCLTEADRLCSMNHGISIKDDQGICRSDSGWIKEQILSITNIDGALFMDFEGKCLALGVIVDGKVESPGDPGKGSRYNSIANYISQKNEGVYLGIIVSEDGMIELVSNLGAKFI